MLITKAALLFATATVGATIRDVSAFSTPSTFRAAARSSVSQHNMVLDHVDVPSAVQSIQDLSMTLADAAAATADAATATADAAAETAKSGWWQNYLDFMENSLITVHNTVDEPLRSIGVTQTWGPSIFFFTAGVRSLLLPLSIQQTKSTEYTKALQPYTEQIKKKYADNKDMQNRATAKLFEDAQTNPLTGCFLSLAQIPVFLGLYRGVTRLARDGFLNEPFLWIPSLQGPVSAPNFRGLEWLTEDWTKVDGSLLPVPSLGWETTLAFLVMPVILVLGQKVTMTAMSPEQPDTEGMSEEEKRQTETSQTVLKFLPLLIGFFSLQVPAGLTIYWFTSNFFTLSQSLAVKAYFKANPPEINLPDYWDALDSNADELTPEEKRKAAEAGLAAGPSFEQLLDEAKFHYVVDRNPVREKSPAWARVQNADAGQIEIPSELLAWVRAAEVANGVSETNGDATTTVAANGDTSRTAPQIETAEATTA